MLAWKRVPGYPSMRVKKVEQQRERGERGGRDDEGEGGRKR